MPNLRWAKKVRWTPAPEPLQPFFTRGRTHRGKYRIEQQGWYFVDGAGQLHGPHTSREAATIMASSVAK